MDTVGESLFAIVVEATDEKAAVFYRDFGFLPFPNRPLRLFMPSPKQPRLFPVRYRSKRLSLNVPDLRLSH
jgi:hypothetical protein